MTRLYFLFLFFAIGSGTAGLANTIQQAFKSTAIQNPALQKACAECKRLGIVEQYDSLFIVIQRSLPTALRLKDSLSIAELHFFLGYYYRGKRNTPNAIFFLKESITIFQKLDDLPNLARSMYTLNTVYADDGNKEEAIRMGLENLKFLKKTKQIKQLASTQSLLGAIFGTLESSDISMQFYEEFVKNHALKIPEIEYMRLSKKAENYGKQGNYSAELKYLKEALKSVRLTKFPSPEIDVLISIAHYFGRRNNTQETFRYLGDALKIAKSINNNLELSIVYREMGMVHLKLGNNEKALSLMETAATLAREDKGDNELITILEELARIEEKTGHYKRALKTISEINIRKNLLLNVERLKFTTEVYAKYNLEKKEDSIKLLNKENRLQRALTEANKIKLETNLQRFYLLFFIVFFLLLLVVTITYFYYKSQKLRAQLARQQEELTLQAKELKESNVLKDKIFSIVSHDLRSPVGSLKASLMMLQNKNQGRVDINQFEQQVDLLQYSLDNILYWSLSQQKMITIRPQRVDFMDIIEEVVDSLRGLLLIKNINLTLNPASATLLIDEQLLTIVLRNIIHNAIKFTPGHGKIDISILSDNRSVEIQVKDSGPGLETTQDSKKSKRTHGTGLGLNLSYELMKRNGGEMELSSLPGEGTTVVLKWQKEA